MQYQAANTITPVSGLQLASTTNQINQDYCHLGGMPLTATSTLPTVLFVSHNQTNTVPSIQNQIYPNPGKTVVRHVPLWHHHAQPSGEVPVVNLEQESFSSQSSMSFSSILRDCMFWVLHTGLWLIVAILIFLGIWNLLTPEEAKPIPAPVQALLDVPHVTPPTPTIIVNVTDKTH